MNIILDLRRLMKLCVLGKRQVLFLFLESQMINSLFLEDINALLQTGNVPNLLRAEDFQQVNRVSLFNAVSNRIVSLDS